MIDFFALFSSQDVSVSHVANAVFAAAAPTAKKSYVSELEVQLFLWESL